MCYEVVNMKLEHQIKIDAPPEVVWRVSIDIERMPELTPTMESVERLDDGPLGVGSKALIKQPGMPKAEWQVTAMTEGESFTWETRVRGIGMIATHELVPIGASGSASGSASGIASECASAEVGTLNTLRVEMSGVVAALLWPFVRRSVRKALEQENAGIKAACEADGKEGF